MIIADPTAPLPDELRGAWVAIGNFDGGVHRGHQALLAAAADSAAAAGRPFGVISLRAPPAILLPTTKPVFRLSPQPLKARLLAALRIHGAAGLRCRPRRARGRATRRTGDRGEVGAGHLVTGLDFHFGKGRRGNADLLPALGPAARIYPDPARAGDRSAGSAPFSSSAIRSALRHGAVAAAAHELRLLVVGAGHRHDRRRPRPHHRLPHRQSGARTRHRHARRHLCRAGARRGRPGAAERHGRRRLYRVTPDLRRRSALPRGPTAGLLR